MFAIGNAFLGGGMNFAIFRNFIQNSFAYISSLEQEKQDPDVMSYLIYFITVTYIQILIQNACSVRNSKS